MLVSENDARCEAENHNHISTIYPSVLYTYAFAYTLSQIRIIIILQVSNLYLNCLGDTYILFMFYSILVAKKILQRTKNCCVVQRNSATYFHGAILKQILIGRKIFENVYKTKLIHHKTVWFQKPQLCIMIDYYVHVKIHGTSVFVC